MLSQKLHTFRIAPYMKEYLTRSTTNSINKAIEYYNNKHYLAEKYITTDLDEPKKPSYVGIFLFIASSATFYFFSHKKDDN